MEQRQVSPVSVVCYRETFRLLAHYAPRELQKASATVRLADLDTDLPGAFRIHLETQRGNTRLAAIRSFFVYVAAQELQHAAQAQRGLAMPNRRYTCCPMDFLVAAAPPMALT